MMKWFTERNHCWTKCREYEDKFKGLKSFLVYMYTHPGKKLTFMGTELAQFIEWDEKRELDWMLLDYDAHRDVHRFVKTLNKYYQENSCTLADR